MTGSTSGPGGQRGEGLPGPVGPVPVGGVPLVGEVVAFDEVKGLGVLRIGERTAPFHCTAVTDGSRSVEVGTVVAVRLGAAHRGRVEARSVRPLPGVTGRGASLRGDARPGQPGPGAALGPRPSPPPPSSRAPGGTTPPSGTRPGGTGPDG